MRLYRALLLSIAATACLFFLTKFVVEAYGHSSAVNIAKLAEKNVKSDDQVDLAVELTRKIHKVFIRSKEVKDVPLLLRMRPYLTSNLLPGFIRFETGAIDAIYAQGFCDGASRTLAFILNSKGLSAKQLNIIIPQSGAHSVVLAETSDGRTIMLDPLYGAYPRYDGVVLSATEAFELHGRGVSHEKVWQPLSAQASTGFYRHFKDAFFGVQGGGLKLDVEIDLADNDAIQLGKQDGKFSDVNQDGITYGLSSFWGYVGHRYDRSWIREITFGRDTKMTIGLTERPDERFITTTLQPEVIGNNLIYTVHANDKLTFVDGTAERDWLRLRSYQDVDFIRFEAIER